jgi:hypothetical protein
MVVLLTLFVGIEYVGCELEPEPEPVYFSDIDKAVAETIKNNL